MTRHDSELVTSTVRGVEVAHWDPRRHTTTWGRPTPLARPVRNFGDLLGPVVVRAIVREFGLRARPESPSRLLAIGSILHHAEFGDVVWGPGLNAKSGTELNSLPTLDLRAVRGPFSRALLERRFGQSAPEVYGDPGLLLGALSPRLVVAPDRRRGVSVVPNLNELAEVRDRDGIVNPRWPLRRVLRRIARSQLVVGSSLHGIIVAEALGVPARAVRTGAEGALKYQDYYVSTGRDPDAVLADDVAEAVQRGGAAPPRWDPVPLLRAFPTDLWQSTADRSVAIERIAGRFAAVAGASAGRFVPSRRIGVDPSEARA